VDLALQLGTEGYSPNLLRKIEYAGGNAPSFAQGSAALHALAELDISPKHVQRLTERLGRERAARRDAAVEAHRAGSLKPRHADPPAVVAIHVDAGKVQTRTDDGVRGVRDPHWRDSKVACLATYPATSYTTDPQPQPPAVFLDPPQVVRLCAELSRVRSGPPPPSPEAPPGAAFERGEPADAQQRQPRPLVRTAVATLGNTEAFGWLVSAEARLRNFYGASRRALLGDGGNWIGPLGDFHFPGWTQVLDFLHLLAHLYVAACCAYRTPRKPRWRQYTHLIREAWAGDVDAVLVRLRRLQRRIGPPPTNALDDDPRRRLDRVIAHVEANRVRMDYARYRREGLPITSTLVESLIKQFNQRMKGTEKFWVDGGAEAVLQVRAALLSEDDRAAEHHRHRPIPRATGRGRLNSAA